MILKYFYFYFQGGLFGVDLIELTKTKEYNIPPAIEEAIDHLYNFGYQTEGLFRISPSKVQLEEVLDKLDKGKDINWDDYSPHIASSTIKEFLRDMPNPLLTKELHEEWKSIEGMNII